ncbi:MAG: PP0621 family protein [Pseudomonadota bacterium]
MKYLLILAIALGVLWLLKNKRRLDADDRDTPPAPPTSRGGPRIATTEVVACDVCDVHLPRSEALVGPKGIYCSAAHMQQAGG